MSLTLVRPWIIQTPMFAPSRFWSHWARHVLPPTTVEEVTDAIVEGIKCKDAVVTGPQRMTLVGWAFQVLPSSLRTVIFQRLRLNDIIA